MTAEFSYNIWNIFNHVNEPARSGDSLVYFYLDGVWKVLDAHTNTVLYRFPGALDICAWLNRNQYQPSPNERVEIIP